MAKKRANFSGRKQRRGANRKARRAIGKGDSGRAAYYSKASADRGYATGYGTVRGKKVKGRSASNPAVKTLKKSTGWIKATRVRIERKGGETVVFVDKPKRRRARR